MAAGATIGSNHNSRGADGEIIAGRGFWPGLCVSLKHNSRFASFNLLAKGDYPAELHIPIPFALISNDVSKDSLVIMPGYWFLYNMYALARNSGKYQSRDKRTFKNQYLEYDFLAPDSVNEMFEALDIMKKAVGKSISKSNTRSLTDKQATEAGEKLLEQKTNLQNRVILLEGIENTSRKVQLVKATEAYHLFKEMIVYYGITQLLDLVTTENISSMNELTRALAKSTRREWTNVGGQLIPKPALEKLTRDIRSGKIKSWDEVHHFYKEQSDQYPHHKCQHAFASLLEILKMTPAGFTKKIFLQLLQQALKTRQWMLNNIVESREKDYTNPFRKMVYESEKEMDTIIGSLKDNAFIRQQQDELVQFKKQVAAVTKAFSAKEPIFS
jgi:hypothetical protein